MLMNQDNAPEIEIKKPQKEKTEIEIVMEAMEVLQNQNIANNKLIQQGQAQQSILTMLVLKIIDNMKIDITDITNSLKKQAEQNDPYKPLNDAKKNGNI